jgi:protein SCO1/2
VKPVRIFLWAFVALALIGLGTLLLRQPTSTLPQPSTAAVNFGGPFTLTGVDGRPFSSSSLAGKPYAIFFGFTHCPDVCPTTLARMVRLRTQISKGSEALNIVFVSVDPERDGPKELAGYVSLFGAPVVGLTGAPAQIAQVKKQFGIFSEKVPEVGGGYTVDHTATVLLFDREGKFVSTISPDEGDSAALDKLKRITG